MTPTTLAETILRDVPRYASPDGNLLAEEHVLAALTAAMDPAIAERAGEVLERLKDEAITLSGIGIDRGSVDASLSAQVADEAADLITSILTANAALRAERDEARKAALVYHGTSDWRGIQATEWKARAEAADAQIAALTARVEGLTFPDNWRDRAHSFKGAFKLQQAWADGFNAARAALSATTEEGHA